jgi:hypothetical protein
MKDCNRSANKSNHPIWNPLFITRIPLHVTDNYSGTLGFYRNRSPEFYPHLSLWSQPDFTEVIQETKNAWFISFPGSDYSDYNALCSSSFSFGQKDHNHDHSLPHHYYLHFVTTLHFIWEQQNEQLCYSVAAVSWSLTLPECHMKFLFHLQSSKDANETRNAVMLQINRTNVDARSQHKTACHWSSEADDLDVILVLYSFEAKRSVRW